jgi:hypothetical protein
MVGPDALVARDFARQKEERGTKLGFLLGNGVAGRRRGRAWRRRRRECPPVRHRRPDSVEPPEEGGRMNRGRRRWCIGLTRWCTRGQIGFATAICLGKHQEGSRGVFLTPTGGTTLASMHW